MPPAHTRDVNLHRLIVGVDKPPVGDRNHYSTKAGLNDEAREHTARLEKERIAPTTVNQLDANATKGVKGAQWVWKQERFSPERSEERRVGKEL